MTGYATSSRESAAGTVTIELKSVNSRFLDLQFRINDDLRALEPLLREAIMARVARGKVECRLSFGRKAQGDSRLDTNEALLASLAELQKNVHARFADAAPFSVNELLRWPGVLAESEISQESLQADVHATLATTLEAFIGAREREGLVLETMLLGRIDDLEQLVLRVTPLVPQAVAQFHQKAIERLQEALGLALGANGNAAAPTISKEEAQDRIRQEVTLYGIRVDVAEELTRLSGHLKETRSIIKKGGQVGKRLDFMMQELNREANTLGSKAALKELSDASMQMKLLIEQMREQIQNLRQRLGQSWMVRTQYWQRHQQHLAAQLEALSPQRTLERGYAVILQEGAGAVRKPDQLLAQHDYRIQLAEGSAEVTLAKVKPQ